MDESKFWEMTVAEIERFIKGATWRMKQKAQFDYQLANLIGVSIGRLIDKEVKLPQIEEAYPILFEDEQAANKKKRQEEEARIRQSQNNFMAFALKLNAKKRGDDLNK